MTRWMRVLLVSALFGCLSFGANAATIDVTFVSNGLMDFWLFDNTGSQNGADAAVDCPTGSCKLLGAVDPADLPGGSNLENELAFLNTLIDPDYPGSTDTLTKVEDDPFAFVVTGQFFWLKFGNIIYAYFENLDSPNEIIVGNLTSQAAGLSHYVQTDGITEISVPGTLGLLILGLFGLGIVRRMKAA